MSIFFIKLRSDTGIYFLYVTVGPSWEQINHKISTEEKNILSSKYNATQFSKHL